MQPHEDGEGQSGRARVGYSSNDPDGVILDALESRYRVATAGGLSELPESAVDCLVVDGDAFRRMDAERSEPSEPGSVPVVVVAGDDPRVARSVARRPGADLVYRDSVGDDLEGSVSDRLCDRVDAACRETAAELDEPILEVAGLLMSAAPDEVDTRIEWGLETVGTAFGAERCVLYDVGETALSVTHEWAESAPLDHESVPSGEFPGFESSLARFDPFVASADPSAVERLGYRGSFVAIPVVIDWDLEWVLAFGGVPGGSPPESALTRLGTFGDLIGHTLRRDRRHREIERQNERLERFASVIRHDLQNPLNVISGFTDLAMETGEPAELERISSAADRMEAILEDLHTLVREAADLGEREPVAVSELVARARETVDTGEATVEVGDVGVVEADPSRLRQAFENLIRNCVEHGSTGDRTGADGTVEHADGGVSIRVSATADGFAVDDDGPGIPEADREAVFEEGYTDGGGTGLGLSIVRTVIEAHGWSVSATESPLGGARFEVSGVEFVDAEAPSATT
jgi:signal transduction histidine kinase